MRYRAGPVTFPAASTAVATATDVQAQQHESQQPQHYQSSPLDLRQGRVPWAVGGMQGNASKLVLGIPRRLPVKVPVLIRVPSDNLAGGWAVLRPRLRRPCSRTPRERSIRVTLMPAGHAASLRAFVDRNTALSDPAPVLPQLGQTSRGGRRYPATQQMRRPVPGPPEGRAKRPSHGHCRRGDRHCLRPSAGGRVVPRISADARSWSTPPDANWLAGT